MSTLAEGYESKIQYPHRMILRDCRKAIAEWDSRNFIHLKRFLLCNGNRLVSKETRFYKPSAFKKEWELQRNTTKSS